MFIRHGETLWNQKGRYQGVADTVLSPEGSRQAKENAAIIQKLIADGFLDGAKLNLVSSTLLRASQTASEIAAPFDCLSRTTNASFRELSMGRWEGLTSVEVKEQFYDERKFRKLNRWTFAPVGGESLHGRADEVMSALSKLQPHTIIVAHSGILRILQHTLGGIDSHTASLVTIPHVGVWLWDGLKFRWTSA